MNQYTVSQWIIVFFLYCFMGWIWECFYVSIQKAFKEKKWRFINRGFMQGPVIPIYGFAALAILIATAPFQNFIPFIFVFGALAATLLELVVGSFMEKMFHIKYWDYSGLPLNYKGHICLFVSLFWGMLSVLMVTKIHIPVENVILSMSKQLTEGMAFVLVILFTYDFKDSLQEALDMKELLEKLDDYKNFVRRLENQMDALIAFTPIPDVNDLREIPQNAKEKFIFKVENMREQHILRLEYFRNKINVRGEMFENRSEMLTSVEKQLRAIFTRTNKQYLRVRNHLKRNPDAVSKRYKDVLKEIKDLFD